MPATRPDAAAAEAGYMLVEAVAALALIGLLLTFALPAVPTGTTAPRFNAVVTAAATLLRDTRSRALGRGVVAVARFDAAARLLRSEAGAGAPSAGPVPVAIPADVALTVTTGGGCPTDGTRGARIVFRADGTNCGAVLRFARGERVARIRVDWVDGRIDVVQGG